MSPLAATITADVVRARSDLVAWLPAVCTISQNDGFTVLATNVPCLVAKPQEMGGAAALQARLQAEPGVTIYLPAGVACPAGAQIDVAGGGSFWVTLAENRRTESLLQSVPAVDLRHLQTITLEYLDANGLPVSRGAQQALLTYAAGVAPGSADPSAISATWQGSLVRPAPFAAALGDGFVLPDGLQARIVSAPHTANGLTSADFVAEQGSAA